MHKIFVILFCSLTCTAYAQQKQVDSLFNVIQRSKDDTFKVHLYEALANNNTRSLMKK